jgi:soluble lytic murein transglycosylase-like protein
MVNKAIKFTYLLFTIGVLLTSFSLLNYLDCDSKPDLNDIGRNPKSPSCLQMYSSIEKYSKKYNVPKYVAYNVAFLETGYRGPFHWGYHPSHISSAGAVGPMQIITKYSHKFAGKQVSPNELMSNIDLNVMVSMKMLRVWYNKYQTWDLACGGYNTGRPTINSYAIFCSSNMDYKKNWVSY